MGKKKDLDIYPSIMCCKPWDFEAYVHAFEKTGVAGIHFDVMDGHYVPNIMLGAEDFKAIRALTSLPIDVHIMATEPERFVSYFDVRRGDSLSFHPEVSLQPYRLLESLRAAGVSAGLALSPGVPVCYLEECLDVLDFVMVMAVSPGFAGQKMVPDHLAKLRRIKTIVSRADHPIGIVVDGNTIPSNARLMHQAGATGLVVGTSSIIQGGPDAFAEKYRDYQAQIACVE
ncbi:ribulose-phosphate 3-epimerase [Olsenella sp. HMSC062G07]|uniref:ribulose-phosphate 3-epimerase n=1 Tax=Olsenella sp. HMSC062G07 TaxID=1739330 RepID=UPI0008A5CD24|nr:ribulose-phosphate 3-epimerase [Olsenella sp. HMSC062G07]OFK23459.1 ribulose phosphate epimerase [Olsenella sp. HMSC062G07]